MRNAYLEKLVIGRLGFQLLAVGDCLLEFGGLGDHDGGRSSSSSSLIDMPDLMLIGRRRSRNANFKS